MTNLEIEIQSDLACVPKESGAQAKSGLDDVTTEEVHFAVNI